MATLRKAGGSVMVTVPPFYLKQHGLTAGSVVNVEIKGDELAITPGKAKLTLADILAAAPRNARRLRAPGWDEMPPAGNEA
ncbi:MAG: AbrB/MazE/SpoVT family DNA-binding domain-containing protein [Gammaproteobacteria bacterium]|nr:AbrB/MazE/SpoVT family DNA-binding domain-containing protein [Gammaproteobacteria bacterium]